MQTIINNTMDTNRIKEIQSETAYPNSISVQQALLKVWNETEQELTMGVVVKPQLNYENVIQDRINYFKRIMHKYEAQRLKECLKTLKELIPPENWND